MVTALVYLGSVAASTLQSALGKSLRPGDREDSFNLHKLSAATLMFAVAALLSREWHMPTALFGGIYGAFLLIATVCGTKALLAGPMALTSVLVSFSLLVPTVCGILFLHETVTGWGIAGLALLLLSFVLIGRREQTNRRASARWLRLTVCTMLANGCCSTVQKLHSVRYAGQYRSTFMVVAFLLPALFLLIRRALPQGCAVRLTPSLPVTVKGVAAGIANGGANYLTLYLAATQNASFLFPVLSFCTALSVLTVGAAVFREKLTARQIIGFFCGAIAVLLLKVG